MEASRSYSVSFGCSPLKNQPTFTGDELIKNLENGPVFVYRQKWRQHENWTEKAAKTTSIYFDEARSTVEIQTHNKTHNTTLQKWLMRYAGEHPHLCKQTDDDEPSGLTFEVDRKRFGIRLTAPYSEEHKKAASELAKKKGLKGRKN